MTAPMVRATLIDSKTLTRRLVNRLIGFGETTEFGQSETTGYDWHFRDKSMRWHDISNERLLKICPYGQPGDRLYVRETFRFSEEFENYSPKQVGEKCLDAGYRKEWAPIQYEADACRVNWQSTGATSAAVIVPGKTRVSIHMPRWASRILLEITGVRVERLNDCSEADAIAEGIDRVENNFGNGRAYCDYSLARLDDTAEWFSSPVHSYRSLWEMINGANSWAANPFVWVVEFKRVMP